MRRKNLLCMLPITLMFLSAILINPVVSAPVATVSVEPPSIVDTTKVPGETFTVDIVVVDHTDAMNLYGFDIKVGYNTSVLTATNVALGDFFPPNSWVLKQEINDTAGADPIDMGGDPAMGYAWYAATLPFGTLWGLNGTGTLFTVTFTVDALGETPLHLYGGDPNSLEPYTVYLLDPVAEEISRTVVDGYFRNLPVVEVGWIEGTVTDAVTDLAIEGVTVSANGLSDVTDPSGFYSIEVPPDTYDVTAEMMGYVSQTVMDVAVSADATVTLNFQLEPVPTEVTIDTLIAQVEEFYEQGEIDKSEIATSLIEKLSAAKKNLEQGRMHTAKNILGAFINHLEAQSGKHVSTQAADILIAGAQHLIDNL